MVEYSQEWLFPTVWNNKFICIGGKSVYFKNLAEKGILQIGDLISDNNEFIVKSNYKLSL